MEEISQPSLDIISWLNLLSLYIKKASQGWKRRDEVKV